MSENNFKKVLETEDTTSEYESEDIKNNTGMAVLSYIIPPIPFFAKKDSQYVQFHAKRGMDLLVVCLAYGIINAILTSLIKVNSTVVTWGFTYTVKVTPWWVTLPLSLIGLAIGIIAILGIINAASGKAKELPLINKIRMFK